MPPPPTQREFSPQLYARSAGFLYLIVIVCGLFAEIFVRQRFVVARDPVATATNIAAHETLFRIGFAADLITVLCVMPLIVLLYELLKVVNRTVALFAVCFSLVGSAIQATSLLGHFAPLVILKHGESPAAAYTALQLQSTGYAIALAFFGGTMLARGYLVIRSRFLPAFIGVLLMIEGVAYLLNSFVDFLAPGFASTVLGILMIFGLAEIILCLWLLIRGVDVAKWMEWQAG